MKSLRYADMIGCLADTWFTRPGAYVLVDGQFGSTGKGVMASILAAAGLHKITCVTTNAGPNSGHTAYYNEEKIMTQQIPVASVFLKRLGNVRATCYLNAGSILDLRILMDEATRYNILPLIHPCAAVINEQNRKDDAAILARVAGTGKGVGPALATKVMRVKAAIAAAYEQNRPPYQWDWTKDRVLVETAQGFSLGLNEHRFYPHTTSRECTVMQAISDARIPAQMVNKVVACYRTYPIRVGNTEGSSGDCYEDQYEVTWEDLGLEPELTSVTKRVRRVFSWSPIQFKESVRANRPDVLFLNFMNYLKTEEAQYKFVDQVLTDYESVMHRSPEMVLLGMSARSEDVQMLSGEEL